MDRPARSRAQRTSSLNPNGIAGVATPARKDTPKSPKVSEVVPLLYLNGMSSGDFVPALEEFFATAAGLSA